MPPKKKVESAEQRRERLALKEKAAQEARDQARLEAIETLERSITQREWLNICKRLDVTRQQIDQDYGLRVLAFAWVQQKREHGGAEWERLLSCTDEELLELLPSGLTPAADSNAEPQE